MNQHIRETAIKTAQSGLRAICGIAGFYRISAEPDQLNHQLGLTGKQTTSADLVRAAQSLGLKARLLQAIDVNRLARIPTPAVLRLRTGEYALFGGIIVSD